MRNELKNYEKTTLNRLQKKVKSWLKAITEINEWEACFVKMTSNVMHQAISLVEVRLENQSNMI